MAAPSKLLPAYIRWDPHYNWFIVIPSEPDPDDMITDFATKEAAIFTAECKGFEGIVQGEEPPPEILKMIAQQNEQLQDHRK